MRLRCRCVRWPHAAQYAPLTCAPQLRHVPCASGPCLPAPPSIAPAMIAPVSTSPAASPSPIMARRISPGPVLRRRLRLPATPHAPQLMGGAEAGFLRDALHPQLAVRDQLARERYPQALHVVERRAAGVLREQPREIT